MVGKRKPYVKQNRAKPVVLCGYLSKHMLLPESLAQKVS